MLVGVALVAISIIGMPGDRVTARTFLFDIPFLLGIALLLAGTAWRRTG
jgi:hypothetical protein